MSAIDASEHFSGLLVPYIRRSLEQLSVPSSRSDKVRDTDNTLDRATILRKGELQDRHRWLLPRISAVSTPRSEAASTQTPTHSPASAPSSSKTTLSSSYAVKPKKKVLLLGSGLVAGPAVDVFVQRGDVELAIGTAFPCQCLLG